MKNASFNHKIKLLFSKLLPSVMMVAPGRYSAITFDDGPSEQNTPALLDVLDQMDIKATHFLSGCEAEKNPGLVQEIVARGHMLGNHGYLHKRVAEIGRSKYVEGVIKTHNLFEEITGKSLQKIFRPPYGELDLFAGISITRQGFQYVMWSYDSCDSFVDTPEKLVAHINENLAAKAEIFLMHEDYAHTVSALPEIIRYWRGQGHVFKRICDIN